MSALESISEWVEDNFTAKRNETPFELFDRIDEAFRADFRKPLDQILKDDMDAFLEFLEDKIERDTKRPIKDPIETRIEPIINRITKGISNFIRGLFR